MELPEDSEIDPDDCTVSEEYPEDYQYKDSYTAEFNGLDIINTWNATTVRVSGKKIWKDDNNAAGLRPEFVTIKLLADGEEIASVKTSKQNGGSSLRSSPSTRRKRMKKPAKPKWLRSNTPSSRTRWKAMQLPMRATT